MPLTRRDKLIIPTLISLLLWVGYLLIPATRQTLFSVQRAEPLIAFILIGYGVAAVWLLRKAIQTPDWAANWWDELRQQPGWVVWGLIFLYWLVLLRFGTALNMAHGLYTAVPLYIWFIGIGLIVAAQPTTPMSQAAPIPTQNRWLIAGLFSLISVVRDLGFFWAHGYGLESDSVRYINGIADFLNPTDLLQRQTMNYRAVTALLNTPAALEPTIALNVITSALMVGVIAFVLMRWDTTFGILVGMLLALDLNLSVPNRVVMPESLYTTCHALAFIWVLYHYENRKNLNRWGLIGAGLFFGWTFTLRSSSLLLLVLTALTYLWMSRSLWKPMWVMLGAVMMIGLMLAVNTYRFGEVRYVGKSGWALSYNWLTWDFYDPANGQDSARLYDLMQNCDPPLGETTGINMENNIFVVTGEMGPCWNRLGDNSETADIWDVLRGTYQESVLANLPGFVHMVIRETDNALLYAVQRSVALESGGTASATCFLYDWCYNLPDAMRILPHENPVEMRYVSLMSFFNQPYLLLVPPDRLNLSGNNHLYLDGEPGMLSALTAFVMLAGFAVVVQRGRWRVLAVGAALVVLYVIAITNATHVFRPRYAVPLSPYYTMLAVLTALTIWRTAFSTQADYDKFTGRRFYGFMGVLAAAAVGMGIFFTVGLGQDEAYWSGYVQADKYLEAQGLRGETFAVYEPSIHYYRVNPPPYTYRTDTALTPRQSNAIDGWYQDYSPGWLQAAGLRYLLVETGWLDNQPEAVQQTITNTNYYQPVQIFTHPHKSDVALYEVISSYRPPIFSNYTSLNVYETLDGRLEFYGIDENLNGFFIVDLPVNQLTEEPLIETENGWQIAVEIAGETAQITVTDTNRELTETFDAPLPALPNQ